MIPPLPRLDEYGISPQNGFLPSEIPLEILPDAYYKPWETIARNFQSLILTKRLRRIIDTLPVLSTDLLLTEAEWRRAYSILGFMAHAYVWGGDQPADVSHRYPPPLVRETNECMADRSALGVDPVPGHLQTSRAPAGSHLLVRMPLELAPTVRWRADRLA